MERESDPVVVDDEASEEFVPLDFAPLFAAARGGLVEHEDEDPAQIADSRSADEAPYVNSRR